MVRSTLARLAIIALFASSATSLAASAALAFSQGSGGSGGETSTFADPDEQINIFGYGAAVQPFGTNGAVQYDAQQAQRGRISAFKHLQIDTLTSPPDPLSRPGN